MLHLSNRVFYTKLGCQINGSSLLVVASVFINLFIILFVLINIFKITCI